MERKTIHIKRTIDIALSVSESETREQAEQWIDENFIPDGHLETLSADHTLIDIRLDNSEDDQDGVVVVSWPESQELCIYEGFYENCDFISGDTIEPCSYLVNKNWYGKLINGELQKVAEYLAA